MHLFGTYQLNVCLIEFLLRWKVVVVTAVAQKTSNQRTEVDTGAAQA